MSAYETKIKYRQEAAYWNAIYFLAGPQVFTRRCSPLAAFRSFRKLHAHCYHWMHGITLQKPKSNIASSSYLERKTQSRRQRGNSFSIHAHDSISHQRLAFFHTFSHCGGHCFSPPPSSCWRVTVMGAIWPRLIGKNEEKKHKSQYFNL